MIGFLKTKEDCKQMLIECAKQYASKMLKAGMYQINGGIMI